MPVLSVFADRVKPVATLVALTSALAMSAPCSSLMVPATEPVICCASKLETNAISNTIASNHDCRLRGFFRFHFI